MKKTIIILSMLALALTGCAPKSSDAQVEEAQATETVSYAKVYDDSADPAKLIDEAVARAKADGKNVICQVGGNWCRWCLMFADFISKDSEITSFIDENYVYAHINNRLKNPETGRQEDCTEAMAKLGNPGRFGYPVFVVLDGDGNILHFQDSSYLEEGNGYNKDKVMRFFKNWTPSAVK